MADKHEIDGVRKEKERLTAAQRLNEPLNDNKEEDKK